MPRLRAPNGELERLHRGRWAGFAFLSRNLAGGGASFYGCRDERPDGTYTTTRWWTMLYIPLVPLGSYEVRDGPELESWYVMRRVPLPRAQLVFAILFLVALVVVGAVAYWKMQPSDERTRGAPAFPSARNP